jgi:hypothetical protein
VRAQIVSGDIVIGGWLLSFVTKVGLTALSTFERRQSKEACSKPRLSRYCSRPPTSQLSFFVRPESPFLRPDLRSRSAAARRGCRRLAGAASAPQVPTLGGHALTDPSTAAGWRRSGRRAFPRKLSRGEHRGHRGHRSHRSLAAGGATRMGGNRASGFRRAATFWPRDGTRSRPLAAASRPKTALLHWGNNGVSLSQRFDGQKQTFPHGVKRRFDSNH